MTKENIQLICFDLDDTLIKQNSWEKLNLALGMTEEEDYSMYCQFKNGELTYQDWTRKIIDIWKARGRATKDNVESTLSDFTIIEGAETAIAELRSRGYDIALLTGSFHTLAESVATQLGIKRHFGCARITYTESDHVHALHTQADEADAKLQQLKVWSQELGLSLDQCACVADGANDLPMFQATGRGITFPDSKIKEEAWRVVNSVAGVLEVL